MEKEASLASFGIFSTYDTDVDSWSKFNCAEHHHDGWWYLGCSNVNLNGDCVSPGTKSSYNDGSGDVIYYLFP